MKIQKLMIWVILSVLVFGCKDGYIDEITPKEPGPDEGAPEVTINYPQEGTELQVFEAVTSIDIDFEVRDDIEIASISILFDGSEIENMTEFLDYRIVKDEYTYDNVTDGQHTVEITATDMEGNSTTESVTFEKVPPYQPKYRGEAFYMPFNGDYMELFSVTFPTEEGTPGFAGEGVAGGNAYAGAANSYLTFPVDGFTNDEFSASFWLNINATPDRAGILVAGPPDPDNPGAPNNRTSGFRFFREAAGEEQRLKLNIGSGDADTWFDGGESADVDPATADWVHVAFSIESGYATVYINGNVVVEKEFNGIDWTGVESFSIMSGAPNFTGWNHFSDLSYMDELRMFTVALTQSEIQQIITDDGGTVGPGTEFEEIFYMPFDEDYVDVVSGEGAIVEGTPGFAGEAKDGTDAYAGATDSYLTFPADGLMNPEFSATFWVKVDTTPDRAGILVISPPDPDNPDAPNKRTSGLRFFREKRGENQIYKLNVGVGDGEVWIDGGDDAVLAPNTGNWEHVAFTVAADSAKIYLNGAMVASNTLTGIDWTGCDMVSIMSGAPRFTGWNHWSDEGYMDELRIFDRALTREEINEIISSDN